jgi:predicted membrane chloride channel (bestrophin family)
VPPVPTQVLTELFDRAPISAKQRLRVDACLSDLADAVGACERILRTPIPVSYTR